MSTPSERKNGKTDAYVCPIVRCVRSLVLIASWPFWFNSSTSDRDYDEKTVNLTSATKIFSRCVLLFGLERKGVIVCGFKANCSLVNTGLAPVVLVRTSDCPERVWHKERTTRAFFYINRRDTFPTSAESCPTSCTQFTQCHFSSGATRYEGARG